VYIYIAGSWGARERLRKVADLLKAGGHNITADWLYITDPEGEWADAGQMIAKRDLTAIDRSSLVLVDTRNPSTSGGYHVETGYALGKYFQVWIVGPRINGFQYLATRHYETWEECLNTLCPKQLSIL
jgi:hypothetical protein